MNEKGPQGPSLGGPFCLEISHRRIEGAMLRQRG